MICTVGTSLFEINLKNLNENTPNKPENWEKIRNNYQIENLLELAKELLSVNPKLRICGAEINTIEEAISRKWLELKNIHFLVSDTDAGEKTGRVLKYYYENRIDLNLNEVGYRRIVGLQDEIPQKFKTLGLRNLVREVGEILNRFPSGEVAIDATGGYKAQIAIAVLIGQALDIPVYYKHERFAEIIDFPAMPISLDYDILGNYADIFINLEKGNTFTKSELGGIDEKFRVFLTEVEVDGETLFELNPIGQIYLTSFRTRFPKPNVLRNRTKEEERFPTFRDDHYAKGFQEFVIKIWNERKWIKTCFSLPYYGQKSIKEMRFYVREEEDEIKLIGTYVNNNFGARFRILLTNESRGCLNWAAEFLNREYGS